MPSLRSLANPSDVKYAEFDIGGAAINVAYKPALITLYRGGGDDDPESPYRLCRDMAKYLVEWDVTGPLNHTESGEELVADGALVPFDPYVMQHMSYGVLTRINQEVIRKETPDPRTRSTSRGR